jgi:hypothetical protein
LSDGDVAQGAESCVFAVGITGVNARLDQDDALFVLGGPGVKVLVSEAMTVVIPCPAR